MRETHEEQIERWAEFVRRNPKKWKALHSEFINSIFANQMRIYKKLSKTHEGRKRLNELYSIKT